MKEEYMKAFTEVNTIIKLMPSELENKIPSGFRKMINLKRDIQYKPDIKEPLEKCELKKETIIILGLIYRDFLCSQDEKRKLQEKDTRELQEIQKKIEDEKIEKYNPNNIFKSENQVNHLNREETAVTLYKKEKWYKKIFNFIKKYFTKNKKTP